MISSTVLTLMVIPAVYSLWKERGLSVESAELEVLSGRVSGLAEL